MRAELIAVGELDGASRQAWRELGAAARSPNPFALPELVLPATRALRGHDVRLLVVREGRRWVAAMPVRHVRVHRRVPGRCLAVWRHEYCFLGTPLVSAERTSEALEQLIACGIEHGGCLALDWIDGDGPLAPALSEALQNASAPVLVERFERGALRVGHGPPATVSARHRSEYRRRRRRLEQEVGPLGVREESHDPAAYEAFLALERSGWKGRSGTALAARERHDELFRAMCSGFAAAGALQLVSLVAGQRRVAMLCNLLAGDTAFGFKTAFDERLRRYGPGMLLMIDYLTSFAEGSVSRLDSCADARNPTVNRLLAERRRLRSVIATAPGPAGLADRLKWRAAAAAAERLRRRAPSDTSR